MLQERILCKPMQKPLVICNMPERIIDIQIPVMSDKHKALCNPRQDLLLKAIDFPGFHEDDVPLLDEVRVEHLLFLKNMSGNRSK
jgi:hypothetical protein